MKKPSKGFLIITTPLLFGVIVGVLYISFTASYVIDGISMLPKYGNSSKVTGVKILVNLQRGDIVTYTPPLDQCSDKKNCVFVGRIIGLPGEKLEMANYFVKINDKKIEETYLAPDTQTLFSPKVGGIFELKNEEYFIMGDNRPYAADSRLFGPIKKSAIQAKIVF